MDIGNKPSKVKKCKQPALQDHNMKSKSDIPCPSTENDPSLAQILAPSLDVMLATNTPLPDSASPSDERVPSSVPAGQPAATPLSSTSNRTRDNHNLASVEQQLELHMEENEACNLLERDNAKKNKLIDELNNCDLSQKLEIRKLSKAYGSLRHELLKYKENYTSMIYSNTDTQL